MEKDTSYLANGGKWDYSYAIGQYVMDCEYNGIKLRNMPSTSAIDLLFDKIGAVSLKWTDGMSL
jgi:hypothetical protein